jgi:hypothetical protein
MTPRPVVRWSFGVVVLGLAAVLTSAKAHAQARPIDGWIIKDNSEHERPWRIDAMANVGFILTVHGGLSVWGSAPLLADGLIPGINDELDVEIGAYVQAHTFYFNCANRWFRVTPLGGLRWSLHLFEDLAVYALVKMGASIPFAAENSCNVMQTKNVTVDGVGALGLYWQLGQVLALRFELGNFGPSVGVSLMF